MKHGQQYILNWLTEPTKRSHQMNSVAAEVLGKFTRAFCNEHLATCTHLKGMEHLYVKRYCFKWKNIDIVSMFCDLFIIS